MCAKRHYLTRAALWAGVALTVTAPALGQSASPRQSVSVPQHGGDWFPEELELDVGEQRVLSAASVRSYSEGVAGIAEVRLTRDAQNFVLVGVRPGTTSLLLLMNDRTERHVRITVRGREVAEREDLPVPPVAARDNIRLDFYFVQLDRGYNHRIGVGTPESVSASAEASFDLVHGALRGATAVVEEEALVRLDMAQAAGFAKLVRKAAVITQNGAEARFSGGGEVNIPVQGSLTTGIHSISFGSSIEVRPRYDASTGRLEVELRASVSDLTDDRGSGTPGRTTSELATVVNLRAGQAVLLGGLSAQSEARSRAGLPLLSQIPLLGLLFGSDRATEQSTENVVFIVPSVVEAVDGDAERSIREALSLYDTYDGDEEAHTGLARVRAAPKSRSGHKGHADAVPPPSAAAPPPKSSTIDAPAKGGAP